MPETDLYDIPAPQRKLMLENMLHGPAFAMLCDKWNEKIDAIQEKINDPATTAADTHELKLVRLQCVSTNHPRKIAEAMIRSL